MKPVRAFQTGCACCLLALVVGCSSEDEMDLTAPMNEFTEDDDTRTRTVGIPLGGGTVDFQDGTILTIPGGALAAETQISLSKRKGVQGLGVEMAEYVQLEPSGLTLSAPATLRISYSDNPDYEELCLRGFTYNEITSEWEMLVISEHDTESNYIDLEIDHFSWIVTIFDRPLDLIMTIPGKYLKKSDLLYCLAISGEGTFSWFPGHAAMYLGTYLAGNDINDGSTIIESIPPDGVQASQHSTFIQDAGHIYMGARRYDGYLSDADRTTIATYATQQIGHGYCPVGEGNITEGNFSCVGLTEAAYDEAGKSIIPAILEFPFILPLEQYIRTLPVNQITIRSGELLSIPVKGVVWDEGSDTYTESATSFSAQATGLPSGSAFQNNTFSWTPQQDHVGRTYIVSFTVTATSDGEVYDRSQSLVCNVVQGMVPLEFVQITAGTFNMGSPVDEPGRWSSESLHEVTLSRDYEIKSTEITAQEYIDLAQWAVDNGHATSDENFVYDALDGSTAILLNHWAWSGNIDFRDGQFSRENPDLAIDNATWYGAAAFCDWLSLKAGLPRAYDHSTWECNGGDPYGASGYRLPTEAEWEYACRSGSQDAFFGGTITQTECEPVDTVLDQFGWYCGNASDTQNVQLKQPNAWGLYDMHGNVDEWCQDWYGSYDSGPVTDPINTPAAQTRIMRGGGVNSGGGARYCRSAHRGYGPPDMYGSFLGFRPARTTE